MEQPRKTRGSGGFGGYEWRSADDFTKKGGFTVTGHVGLLGIMATATNRVVNGVFHQDTCITLPPRLILTNCYDLDVT